MGAHESWGSLLMELVTPQGARASGGSCLRGSDWGGGLVTQGACEAALVAFVTKLMDPVPKRGTDSYNC